MEYIETINIDTKAQKEAADYDETQSPGRSAWAIIICTLGAEKCRILVQNASRKNLNIEL